tara:strand:+ start:1104 stop:1685 length:582 start_codon:yes stop_codon:yes gene_type:complete
MANRVLLGKRGSEYGLFISQKDVNVTDTSSTTPLAFDSRAVRGLAVHAKGEGSLAPNSSTGSGGVDFATTATITHNLGYVPLYAVRWCYASDLSSGVAQRMYTPSYKRFEDGNYDFADDEEESDWVEISLGGISTSANTSTITINNHEFGYSVEVGNDDAGTAPNEEFGTNKQTIYYAYIIFKAKDFTGGLGL